MILFSSIRDNDTSSARSDLNASSSSGGFKIQYNTITEDRSNGAWGGYQTQDDFMTMHLR